MKKISSPPLRKKWCPCVGVGVVPHELQDPVHEYGGSWQFAYEPGHGVGRGLPVGLVPLARVGGLEDELAREGQVVEGDPGCHGGLLMDVAAFSLTAVMQQQRGARREAVRPSPWARERPGRSCTCRGRGSAGALTPQKSPGGAPMGTVVILITELALAGTFYFERLIEPIVLLPLRFQPPLLPQPPPTSWPSPEPSADG